MSAPWRLAALALVLVALPMQAQHRSHRSRSTDRDAEYTLDTTVALSRSGTVDLQGFSTDIVVTGWDRDEVKVHAVSGNPLQFDASPSHLSLTETPEERDGDGNDRQERIEISMPRGARLLARSISGDVKLQDVSDVDAHSVSGDLDATNIGSHAQLETVSGDLNVTKVSAGLRASSVSGSIKARQITGEVSAQSVSGDIVLDDVTSGYVRTETVSGEVHFRGPVDPKGRYEFHSHSGDLDLDLTGGGANASLDVETYSGDLNSSCSMTLQPGDHGDRSSKHATFTLGNGNGAHFILKTFSGDVHITGCRAHGDN